MQLTIDGKAVTARDGESVLQCALRHRINIPHLCTHPSLPAFGACRMCIVEIEGLRGFPASCATPASEGMVVRTDTPALQDLRRRVLELILLEHPSACLVCDKQELCDKYRPHAVKAGRTTGCHTCNNKEVCEVRSLADVLELKELPVAPVYRGFKLERSDPFIDRDLNLCILCGRCVRICKAHHGKSTIDFVGRGSQTHIGEAFGRSLTEAGCRFCGSCIDVCPTGSLSDRYGKWFGAPQRVTATTCTLCDAGCAITVHVSAQNRAVMTRAISTRVPLCVIGRFAMPEFLNGAARLKAPQVRINNVLRPVKWPEALALAADRLRSFVGAQFALVCDATGTLEDRYVLQRFTRQVMRSSHYIELQPDQAATTTLPAGIKAIVLTGGFVDPQQLSGLDLVIVQDCYPSAVTPKAHITFPAAVLAEVAGTWVDSHGLMRPLRQACDAPGTARPDWQIISELARAMGAPGFDYASATAIKKEIGAGRAGLRIRQAETPPAAADPRRRRTHFRGHFLEERVRGLAELAVAERPPTALVVGA